MIFTSLIVGLTAAGVGAVIYVINKDKRLHPEVVQRLSKQENIGEAIDRLRAKQAQQAKSRPLKPRKKARR